MKRQQKWVCLCGEAEGKLEPAVGVFGCRGGCGEPVFSGGTEGAGIGGVKTRCQRPAHSM